jgi:hypothetical protein
MRRHQLSTILASTKATKRTMVIPVTVARFPARGCRPSRMSLRRAQHVHQPYAPAWASVASPWCQSYQSRGQVSQRAQTLERQRASSQGRHRQALPSPVGRPALASPTSSAASGGNAAVVACPRSRPPPHALGAMIGSQTPPSLQVVRSTNLTNLMPDTPRRLLNTYRLWARTYRSSHPGPLSSLNSYEVRIQRYIRHGRQGCSLPG